LYRGEGCGGCKGSKEVGKHVAVAKKAVAVAEAAKKVANMWPLQRRWQTCGGLKGSREGCGGCKGRKEGYTSRECHMLKLVPFKVQLVADDALRCQLAAACGAAKLVHRRTFQSAAQIQLCEH
jgi:hypothetical protein